MSVPVREQLKELTKQYEKSENDLKALQSVGQVMNIKAVPNVDVLFSNIKRNTFGFLCHDLLLSL